jgi:hypothetical protein
VWNSCLGLNISIYSRRTTRDNSGAPGVCREKYNALYHLNTGAFLWHQSRAATGSNFIGTKEEKALYISEHNTVDWRKQNNIPDSDGLNWGQTRKRSDSFNSSF